MKRVVETIYCVDRVVTEPSLKKKLK